MEFPHEAFSDVRLRDFRALNPHAYIVSEDDAQFIENLWNVSEVRVAIDWGDPDFAGILNAIRVNPRFDAIIHTDTNEIEFAFGVFPPDHAMVAPWLARQYSVHFRSNEHTCRFDAPSDKMLALANIVRRLPSDTNTTAVPQFRVLRDLQRLDDLPRSVRSYFDRNSEARSFYINGISADTDLASLCRHVNLLSHYYDRLSPQIVVRNEPTDNSEPIPRPNRMVDGRFPATLNCREVDDVLLTLLEVAGDSSPRAAFLYYYQIYEYAGHYYVDDAARTQLRRLLRDPAIADFDERRRGTLFSILAELHRNDEQRMQKVIQDHCDPMHLWPDIENDREFFTSTITFDGGFELIPLVSNDTTSDAWCKMWTPNLFQRLTKIRNCLVHAREKRENRVIFPTPENNSRLKRIIPLAKRIAEDLALRG